MLLSLSKEDMHRRSHGFGPGLVWIRDRDERVGSPLAALVVWPGGVRPSPQALVVAHTGSGSATVDGRRIWVARSGALNVVWTMHRLLD